MRAGDLLARRYRLERLLGRGAMGEVWEGFDERLRRRVAVKVLSTDLLADPRAAEQMPARFRREGEAAARLNHRNIAAVHDLDEHVENGTGRIRPFLVLEHLDGRDLQTLLRRHPRGLPLRQVVEYGLQVCDGLAAAHAAGIVHRDIKPANLMVLDDGTVKICDFGIARLQDATVGLTREGFQPGTPAYMAPEQLDGGPVDHRADLYALGATLYHLLTGRTVFPADDLRALIAMHLTKIPDPPSAHRPDVPHHLDTAISALLAKDPAQRPASAAQAATSLKSAPVAPNPLPASHRRPATLAYTRPASQEQTSAKTVAGGPAGAHPLLAEAERIARSITDPHWQATVLVEVVGAMAKHAPVEAEHFALSFTNPRDQAAALAKVAGAVAVRDPAGALSLLGEAERIARTLTASQPQAWLMTEIAGVLARHDPGRCRALLAEAEDIARSVTSPGARATALAIVVGAVAERDLARAERIIGSLTDRDARNRALMEVAGAMAEHDPARAERVARSISDARERAVALARVAGTMAAHTPVKAEVFVRHLTASHVRDRALAEVAGVVAARTPFKGRRIARSIEDPAFKARALAKVAGAVAVRDPAGALSLLREAERIARSIIDSGAQEKALGDIVRQAMDGGRPSKGWS